MHASGILSTLLLVLGGSRLLGTADARRCFGGHSLNRDTMKLHARNGCEGYVNGQGQSVKGAFQGFFSKSESRKVCVEMGIAGKFDMEVYNTNTRDGFDIKDSDCTKELHKLIDNCLAGNGPLAYGGEDTVAGWYFKADANAYTGC